MFQMFSIKRSVFSLMLLIAVAASALMLQPGGVARAAVITVNTNTDTGADDGLCSLREAIEASNNDTTASTGDCIKGSGTDTITFAPGLPTIMLTSNLPTVNDDVNFNGAAAGSTRIDGSSLRRSGFHISNANVKIVGMTFQNGSAAPAGGAIIQFGSGTLAIQNSKFIANSSSGAGGAIALTSVPSLTITDSLFQNNSANSVISSGGAIFVDTDLGKLTLTNNIFDANSAGLNGGAIFVDGDIPGGISISGGAYANNSAGENGGVIGVAGSVKNISVKLSEIRDNAVVNGDGGVFNVPGALTGTVKIEDSLIQSNGADGDDGGVLAAPDGGSLFALTMTGSEFLSNRAAGFGGVVATSGTITKLTVTDSNFNSNLGYNGGVVHAVSLGALSIKDSDLSQNEAYSGAGGVVHAVTLTGSIKINGSFLSGNSAGLAGGAIAVEDAPEASSIKISDTTFLGNETTNGRGGAMSLNGPFFGSVKISDSRFEDNKSGGVGVTVNDGGALYLDTNDEASVKISASTFASNESSGDGGAISMGGGTLKISESIFELNSTDDAGGALYVFDDAVSVSITGSTFSMNTATNGIGGAVLLLLGGQGKIQNSLFDGNAALEWGGAIGSSGGTALTISGVTFTNNTASTDDGGGALITGVPLVSVTNSIFGGNMSGDEGGGLYIENDVAQGQATIKGSVFGMNGSIASGGAIEVDEDTTLIMTGTRVHDNLSSIAGGILFFAGTFTNNCFEDNGVAVLDQDGGSDVRNNWWGAASGPSHPIFNPSGSGNQYSPGTGAANFLPFLTSAPGCPTAFVP